jgi:5-methylcytosine-specific restriction endonuclease McrA
MIITEEHLRKLKTKKGGYTTALIKYAKEVTGSSKFKKALLGFNATEEQWNNLLKRSGYTRRERTEKKKEKKRFQLLNPVSKPDGWSWKPPTPPPVKRESKNCKHQGKKAARREAISKLDNRDFYLSDEWRALRVRVLEKYDCKCMMCGRSPKAHGIVIHVDHIKPRSKYPELSLTFENLQLLCEDCNIGKCNKYSTDWRPDGNETDYEILETLPVTMQ